MRPDRYRGLTAFASLSMAVSGRGLWLPVMANGDRRHDEQYSRLTVVANERYEEFARALQSEIEEECGESFAGRVENKCRRRTVARKPLDAEFQALWSRIKHKTRYAVVYSTKELIDRGAAAIRTMPAIEAPKIVIRKGSIGMDEQGVTHTGLMVRDAALEPAVNVVPDLVAYLQRETNLTRMPFCSIPAGWALSSAIRSTFWTKR